MEDAVMRSEPVPSSDWVLVRSEGNKSLWRNTETDEQEWFRHSHPEYAHLDKDVIDAVMSERGPEQWRREVDDAYREFLRENRFEPMTVPLWQKALFEVYESEHPEVLHPQQNHWIRTVLASEARQYRLNCALICSTILVAAGVWLIWG